MYEIDNITIIAGSILIVLAIATPFVNVFIRRQEMSEEPVVEDVENNDAPKISVVITPHENSRELEKNLPYYLSQDYEGDYEVIVVAWKGDSETDDVLKRFAGDPHLYTTYIPTSSRYMSRKKLAITIGVKAAKYEWVMLTDIECRPMSNQWLHTMARNCNDNTDMIIGHTCFYDDTPPYRRFERLHTELYLLREYTHGTAYRCESKNLIFRKSMFIEGDGFRGNLKYLRGEYDFIVNKYANSSNVTLELHPEAWNMEETPTDKTWRNNHLFYLENRKHMERSASHRILYNIDQSVLHGNYLIIALGIAFAAFTQRWIMLATAIVALVITIVLRTVIASKSLRMFSEDISAIKIPFYEIAVRWHRIGYMLRYMRTDKNDFISHKL